MVFKRNFSRRSFRRSYRQPKRTFKRRTPYRKPFRRTPKQSKYSTQIHVKCETIKNITYLETWPATPTGMDATAARFAVFWESRPTIEPYTINPADSSEFNYWAQHFREYKVNYVKMEYQPVTKLQVSGSSDKIVDFAEARLASFEQLQHPNISNTGEILNIYSESAMHNRPDYRTFNSGRRTIKSLSVAKWRAKHRLPSYITTGFPNNDMESARPIGTAWFMNVHGLPDGYGIGRMKVTYWVSFRG